MLVKSRSYFSIPHLVGAARLASEVLKLEIAARASKSEEQILAHRGAVMAVLASCVAALEAMVNELIADAADADHSHSWTFGAISLTKRNELAQAPIAVKGKKGIAILLKFKQAHLVLVGSPIDQESISFRNARNLILLRNSFVHPHPAWREHNVPKEAFSDKSLAFLSAMHGLFPENTLTTPNTPFYPDRILGFGCARWAFKSALDFADAFWKAVGIVPRYEAYRHYLQLNAPD